MQVHNVVFITMISNLELPVESSFFPLKYTKTSVYLFSLLDTYEIRRPALGQCPLCYSDTSRMSHLWGPKYLVCITCG